MSVQSKCRSAVDEIKNYMTQFDRTTGDIYAKYVKTKPQVLDKNQLSRDIASLKNLIAEAGTAREAIASVAAAGQSLGGSSDTRIRNAKILLETISKIKP